MLRSRPRGVCLDQLEISVSYHRIYPNPHLQSRRVNRVRLSEERAAF